jgi:hypothetical protein
MLMRLPLAPCRGRTLRCWLRWRLPPQRSCATSTCARAPALVRPPPLAHPAPGVHPHPHSHPHPLPAISLETALPALLWHCCMASRPDALLPTLQRPIFDTVLRVPAAGQQVPRTQVVRGIAFVYLPPPRRKVPFAAAIASAPLPRWVIQGLEFAAVLTRHCHRHRLRAAAAVGAAALLIVSNMGVITLQQRIFAASALHRVQIRGLHRRLRTTSCKPMGSQQVLRISCRSMMTHYAPAPPPGHPQMRSSAASIPTWPQPPQQRTLQQAVQQQLYPAPQRALQCHPMQQPAPPLQLQPLPGGSIWSSSAVGGTTGWPTAASAL